MTKVFAFLRRRAGTTPEVFHERWTAHAARLAETAELARHVRRFELNERLAADRARTRHAVEVDESSCDGVAVLWFDDLDAVHAFAAEPALGVLLADDVPRFVEGAPSFVVTREPDVVLDLPGGREAAGAKLLCLLRRKPGMQLAAFHDHWLRVHGGLFRAIPDLGERLSAYDQNHGDDLADAEWDGVTEQWFPSLEEWAAGLGIPARTEHVLPDMQEFLDLADMRIVIAGPPLVVI